VVGHTAPGIELFLIDLGGGEYAGTAQSTVRNSSCAVCPIRAKALLGFFIPGNCTTMFWPCEEIFGWATPSPSTRFLIIEIVWSSTCWLTGLTGLYTTDAPPWRSRPKTGLYPKIKTAANAPRETTTEAITENNRYDLRNLAVTPQNPPNGISTRQLLIPIAVARLIVVALFRLTRLVV
jgi:hypothetical protein